MPTYTAGKPQASEFHVEPGVYRFKVIEAKDDSSRAGNEMIKLKVRIIKPDGSDGPSCFDYLVFSANALWKVDSFLKSVDKHPGEGVSFNVEPDDLIGCEGEARFIVEPYEGKKNNKVEAYLFDEF
jgi:hypothetical protein